MKGYGVEALEYRATALDEAADEALLAKADRRVEDFLDIFLREAAFIKVTLVNSGYRYLRNSGRLGLRSQDKTLDITALNAAVRSRRELARACTSHGHMSVLLYSKSSAGVAEKYLSLNHYGSATKVRVGAGGEGDPLTERQREDFLEAIMTPCENCTVFLFSHDADYLFTISE